MTDNIEIDISMPAISIEQEKPTISADMVRTTPIILSNLIPAYDGPYEITPTEEAQILPTAGTRLENNIVVNPIPSNYGRIEWNGVTLRVF